MKSLLERGDFSSHAVRMLDRNTTELIGVPLAIIGLVMGLAAVKAGASLLVMIGIALIDRIGDFELGAEIISLRQITSIHYMFI